MAKKIGFFNMTKAKRINFLFIIFILLSFTAGSLIFTGCRNYDGKFDVAYFFKTEPEKAVIDFLNSIENHDAEYIYSNFLPDDDRRKVSREKFIRELSEIFSKFMGLINVNRLNYLAFLSIVLMALIFYCTILSQLIPIVLHAIVDYNYRQEEIMGFFL